MHLHTRLTSVSFTLIAFKCMLLLWTLTVEIDNLNKKKLMILVIYVISGDSKPYSILFCYRERNERRLHQRTHPRGTLTVNINATDIFTEYEEFYDEL